MAARGCYTGSLLLETPITLGPTNTELSKKCTNRLAYSAGSTTDMLPAPCSGTLTACSTRLRKLYLSEREVGDVGVVINVG